jgi:hypothetical protein
LSKTFEALWRKDLYEVQVLLPLPNEKSLKMLGFLVFSRTFCIYGVLVDCVILLSFAELCCQTVVKL